MITMTVDDLMALHGNDVFGNDGNKIGSLEQVYVDNYTGEPAWVFGTNLSRDPPVRLVLGWVWLDEECPLTLILQRNELRLGRVVREMPLYQRECGVSKTARYAGEGHLPGECYRVAVRC
jgi:hypothetical protein